MSLRAPKFDEHEASQVINISPLIDVIFILLIFFIVTMTFADTSALQLDRPESSTAQEIAETPLTIRLSKEGDIELNSRRVQISALKDGILAAAEGGEFCVVIDAHAAAPVQKLVDVMDCAKECGAKKIFISAKKK